MRDFLGHPISLDDRVVFLQGKYVNFYPGVVIDFTPKKVRLRLAREPRHSDPTGRIGDNFLLVDPSNVLVINDLLDRNAD